MEEKLISEKRRIPNQKLKQERERRFWTLEDVAKRISNLPGFAAGIPDPRTVARWERGISFPSPRYCAGLCAIFEMEPCALGLTQHRSKGEERADLSATVADECPAPEAENLRTGGLVAHILAEDSSTGVVQTGMECGQAVVVMEAVHGSVIPPAAITSSSLSQESKYRHYLLKKVRSFWINNVLEQSLRYTPQISLQLRQRPDAIINPWHMIVHEVACSQGEECVSLIRAYDEADGALLLLGEPGAGKTTLLLQLARILLARAEQDQLHAIPVIFNLSSWALKRGPLAAWLVQELHEKYQIPLSLARHWVNSEQILLLFDGLDEIAPAYRSACIQELNSYRRKYGMTSLVVCSRLEDYLIQPERLLLHGAAQVQVLSKQQIDATLEKAALTAIHTVLSSSSMLQALVTTPLWLHVLVLACQAHPDEAADQQIEHIVAKYVQHMLRRRSYPRAYTAQHMYSGLRWLAQQMYEQRQEIFYLEQMQPTLLDSAYEQACYTHLTLHLAAILIGILVVLLVCIPCYGYASFADLLVYSLCGALVGEIQYRARSATMVPALEHSHPHLSAALPPLLRWVLLMGLNGVMGLRLYVEFSYGPQHRFLGEPGVVISIIGIPVMALILSIHSKLLDRHFRRPTICPVEVIFWSPWRFRYHLLGSLRFALIIGGLVGLYAGLRSTLYLSSQMIAKWALKISISSGISVGLGAAFCSWLLLSIFQGIECGPLEDHLRIQVNQGIRCSVRHALLSGLAGFVAVFMASTLFPDLLFSKDYPMIASFLRHFELDGTLAIGLAAGLLTGLRYGGWACVQQGILCLLLWRKGRLSWCSPHFLDAASGRLLLRKIGGGYVFSHRLLQEHFLSNESSPLAK